MKAVISFILLLYLSGVQAQKPLKEFYLKRSLKQDEKQWEFTVLDEDKHGVLFYDKSKFYFWYRAQKVISTQGASSGILLHGECEAFYQNKQLALKGNFVRGLKHGQWLYWREDGTLEKSEHWCKGEKRGVCKLYNEEGEVIETIRIKKNSSEREVGDSLIHSRKQGKLETITLRNSLDQVYRVEHKKNGELDGKVFNYKEGKLISIEKYKNGELVSREDRQVEKTDGEQSAEKEKKSFFSFLKKEKAEKKPKKKREKKE